MKHLRRWAWMQREAVALKAKILAASHTVNTTQANHKQQCSRATKQHQGEELTFRRDHSGPSTAAASGWRGSGEEGEVRSGFKILNTVLFRMPYAYSCSPFCISLSYLPNRKAMAARSRLFFSLYHSRIPLHFPNKTTEVSMRTLVPDMIL